MEPDFEDRYRVPRKRRRLPDLLVGWLILAAIFALYVWANRGTPHTPPVAPWESDRGGPDAREPY